MILLVIFCIGLVLAGALEDPKFQGEDRSELWADYVEGNHTNTWAVLVCSSAWWYNYRHVANTLAVYHAMKERGIPDDRIVLMLAEDIACNARNTDPGRVYDHPSHRTNLYDATIRVDYRGEEVTAGNLLRVLTGRHAPDVPASKRLLSDSGSNVLFYMTGHGGAEFLKLQDSSDITSGDLADAFDQMWEMRRYHRLLFIVDTCQATTLYYKFRSPNIVAFGSSGPLENSYSIHMDSKIGTSLMDRFTYHMLAYLSSPQSRNASLLDLANIPGWSRSSLSAQARYRSDLLPPHLSLSTISIDDFFGDKVLPLITTPTTQKLALGE